jgi:hypothetical protein
MMNKIEEIKYKELLDLDWALRKAELKAKSEWDDVVEYGKDELLYELRYETVKELRDAQKVLKKVVDALRANDLYTNEI